MDLLWPRGAIVRDAEPVWKGCGGGRDRTRNGQQFERRGLLAADTLLWNPGSSGMAIFMGALVTLGVQPGPQMATVGLNFVWTMIWTLAIANILAVVILLGCVPWFSKLASLRSQLLVPFVIVLSMLGCYLGAGAWQNFIVLLVLGFIGYLFKKNDWPRAPFVVGIVLGPIAESSLHKAMAIWGYSFLARPLSLVMLALILAPSRSTCSGC